jgi:hypothetical protein
MKKIFLSLNILLFLCAAINSCIYDKIDENGPEEPNPPGPGPTDPDEKIYFVRFTLLPMSGSSARVDVDWSNYRNVGLFINGSNPIRSNRKIDIAEESGSVSVLLFDTIITSDADGLGFAYAPYKDFSGTTISGILMDEQNQTIDIDNVEWTMDKSVIRNNMILVAEPVSFKLNQGTCPLVLKNIFSLIRLKVIKSPSFGMNNRMVRNIRLYIADANNILQPINSMPLSGSYTMDLSANPAAPQFTSPSYAITAAINGYSTIGDNPGRWYAGIAVNPFTLKSNERLVAAIETNGNDVIYSSFDNLDRLDGNTVYDYTITASEENTYFDQISEQYLNAYSNCYIISEKGKYIIPADKTIEGNPLLLGDKADWLWASKEGGGAFQISDLIDPSMIVYDGSRITFQVGDKNPFSKMQEGNVILALKDADDNIVWTWHIWITGDEVEDEDVRYGKIFLNRNIGALSADTLSPAIDTYGFVYQWGRKDPFIGGDGQVFDESTGVLSVARAHSIINPANTWGADAENVKKWSQAEASSAGTLEASVKYPMRFIYNGTSSSEHDPADWLSVSNPGLWSDNEKTDYDPCPYGYKVPAKDDFSMLYSAFDQYLYYLEHAQSSLPLIWFYNRDNSNRYWMYSYQGASAAWPIAGMRQGRHASGKWIGAQLKYSGNDRSMGHGYYWTSTPWIMRGLSYSINMRGTVLYSNDTSGPNADAYPVRCVQYP